MDKIEELKGIILGINYDEVINELEVKKLNEWLEKNRSLSLNKEYAQLIQDIENILEDRIIDEEERDLLLKYADQYIYSIENVSAALNELNGIIEGVVCDNVVNDKEIRNLKKWLSNHKQLNGVTVYDNINQIIN